MINKPLQTNAPSALTVDPITYEPPPEQKVIKQRPVTTITPPPAVKIEYEKIGDLDDLVVDTTPDQFNKKTDELEFGTEFGPPDIRVAPQYPNSCQSRSAEGEVLVQFDVTPEGDVVNITILESANSCFNATVIRAVSRWKYTPGKRNGKAVARRGLVEKFSFQLED